MTELIAAIDQGTTSTRCILFDPTGEPLASAQMEHAQHTPAPGLVEHDAGEIRRNTDKVVREALAHAGASKVVAVGITNQRETVVFWNRETGEPCANAIVWQDTRTRQLCDELGADEGAERFRATCGLPLSTYFSGPKITWALRHVEGLRAQAEAGRVLCGTMDSWVIWNLTGGPRGGRHVTDVTNASRTMLMDLASLDWDEGVLEAFSIPRSLLPEIVPSSDAEAFGRTAADGPFGASVPITAAVGDQQAALIGQGCFSPGDAKNTYGTGCFLLSNTGERPVTSTSGMLTTLAYRFADAPAVYALEGSVAVAGSLVQWLRDNLGFFENAEEVEALARTVPDSGGVFVVPAFSGLFAPRWRPDARGVIVGLTRFVERGHIARAALEATCFQTREVLAAMEADTGLSLDCLKVDGGMVANELLMQTQADLLGIPVVRPAVIETTAVGAAFAAGMAVGYYPPPMELARQWREERRWTPDLPAPERAERARGWDRAVERSLGWVE
ncbi:MAG: glycerol kinase GlpK [Planctomycetota bacterium]|jgi:glycerol kinase|nr:glycerol kinase GlpK [Planctomycetota bacterium]MDP6763379.1 glycerol kinase GlpK [Planctomycetota bacterium]MDP6988647.1 glycerol kinase GlpK [Planctomycetota bacterium]